MARKKKKTFQIPPIIIKVVVIGLLSLALGIGLCRGVWYTLMNAPYFKVKYIVIEPSLQFINTRYIQKVKGVSIFAVDLQDIEQKLSRRYPQVSDLEIVRKFPHTVFIGAKQRKPIAQITIHDRLLTLDYFGVVLSTKSKLDGKVPVIKGVDEKRKRFTLGRPLGGNDIKVALQLVKAFEENRILDSYDIMEIDVSNLSKIEMMLSNDLKVLMDKNDIKKKINILGFVLTKKELNLNEIRYLDLRFKDPIIGKK